MTAKGNASLLNAMEPDRILIVDDDRFMRITLRNLLEKEGYAVTEADSGTAALEGLASSPPDLILLDLVMPGMDGLETCRRLRRHPAGALLPVVVVTGRENTEAIAAAFEAGASDFLTKPILPALLDYRIRFLLRSSRLARELHLSRQQLGQAQDMARIGSWEWRPGDSWIRLSGWAGSLLDLPEEHPIPLRRLLGRVPAKERKALLRLILGSAGSGEPFRTEHRLRGEGDRERIVVHWGEVLTGKAPGERKLFGILQDVTEQRRDSDDLLLLRRAVDCLPMGITITDTTGRICYTNPAEADLHGYSREELLGRQANLLGPDRLRQPNSETVLNRFGCWQRETVNLRKDGSEFPVQLHSVGVSNASGDPLGMVTACADISDRKEAERRIHSLAYFDPLTGLPNRRMFQDRLEQAMAQASRNQCPLALLFLDLNRFKEVNDHFGHPFGDRMLREVAGRLSALCRKADTLARLGGDEFVFLLCSGSDHRGSRVVCDKILAALAAPFSIDGREVFTGVSIGVALYPEDADDSGELLRCADTAMYSAKERGGSGYRYYARGMDRKLRQKLAMERSLRATLEGGSLPLRFQPWYDGRSGKMAGADVQLAWDGDVGQLAEETGLMSRLQERLIQAAGDRLREWSGAGLGVPLLCLPLVEKVFPDGDRWQLFAALLQERGVASSGIEFRLKGPGMGKGSIPGGLGRAGFRFGLDAFSPACAELSAWTHLPLGRLRLGAGLSGSLPGEGRAGRLVRGMIDLAHAMDLPVLATGVASQEQQLALRALGSDQFQGSLLAPPLAEEEFREHLCGQSPSLPSLFSQGAAGSGSGAGLPGA